MTYVIAEPCIGVKDTACVDACPVDCIHPKKNTTYDARTSTKSRSFTLTPWSALIAARACPSARSPRFSRWTIYPRSGSTSPK
jgi:NAD-dependent dihydropyrimidine dehydrogenase PreA subunit